MTLTEEQLRSQLAEAERKLAEAKARAESLQQVLERARVAAGVLLQNAEGCAVNHYGQDFSLYGMPGWLADCRRDIEALSRASLNKEQV